MVSLQRRHLLVSAATAAAAPLFGQAALAQDATTFSYRGFTVDVTAARTTARPCTTSNRSITNGWVSGSGW
jgi:hypothetical protein